MQPNLENIKNKVKANRDLIDRIRSQLPGFKGYVEKAEMSAADKIIRNFIADGIQRIKNEINSLSGELFRKNENQHLADIEVLNTNLERLLKKCKFADFGESSFHSNIKVSDEDQNRLLEYDWRMIAAVDDFNPLVAALRSSGDLKKSIEDIIVKIKEFEKTFDDRKYVLTEVI